MKRLALHLAIASLLVTSCSSETTKLEQYDASKDYSTEEPTPTRTISKEAAETAYGRVKFGSTEKEYKKLVPEISNVIGEFKYMILPQFNGKGKLFGVYIQGYKENANYLDNRLVDQVENLRKTIQEKYGSPTQQAERPSIIDFQPGKVIWQYSWELSTKRIQIGLSEEDTGNEYRAVCYIYDEPMMAMYKTEIDSEAQQKVKRSANDF